VIAAVFIPKVEAMAGKLTQMSVEKFKPKAHRVEVADGLLPGLYLVVQPSGAKSWAVRYRHEGRPRKFTIGAFPALGVGAARQAAQAALRAVQGGADPAQRKQAAKLDAKHRVISGTASVVEAARLYLERYQQPRNRDWREVSRLLGLVPAGRDADRNDLAAFVVRRGSPLDRWRKKPAGEIAKRDVLACLDAIVSQGAPVGANRTLQAVRRFFGWLVEREIVTDNPTAGIRAPSPEEARDRVLNDAELAAVWRAAERLPWFAGVVRLLVLTGQRRDEVARMTWPEVDVAGRLWTIPASRAKNNVAHLVPLSDAAVAILESLPRVHSEAGFVFTTNGKTPISGFSKAKAELDKLALAELRKGNPNATPPGWRLHDIRRSVATGLARLGTPVHVTEKLLNHVSGTFAGVTGIYQRHDYLEERRNAMRLWGAYIMRLASGKAPANVVALASRAKA
jgi:integrase